MKRNSCTLYRLILLAGLFIFLPANVSVFAAAAWEELPPLVFQEYVEVETVIAPNPYSERSNDFLVVTKYEEGEKAGAVSKRGGDARQALKSLNVYLVTGLIIMEGGEVGIPYHTSLIVSLRSGGNKPSGRTIQQWVLSDEDGDGKLDQARFQKTTTSGGGRSVRSEPIEAPQDQVGRYQAYYENASRELNSKADISLEDE